MLPDRCSEVETMFRMSGMFFTMGSGLVWHGVVAATVDLEREITGSWSRETAVEWDDVNLMYTVLYSSVSPTLLYVSC
ncbi:hypothetical protein KOW79_019215 [Hemibagrus wyckioides]|uniref:Uncharacterized protein n=1 Tax=Hemibagrus wyckioides TaxID=337641 RepID=A0A9D3N772_9TELE|nr:hypothetical protein KOW79_019215 [Hemibagrus wyckioides]